jgi:hypothetical protein
MNDQTIDPKYYLYEDDVWFLRSSQLAAELSRFGRSVLPAPVGGVRTDQTDGIYVSSGFPHHEYDIQVIFVGVAVDTEWLLKAANRFDLVRQDDLPIDEKLHEQERQRNAGRFCSVMLRKKVAYR